MAEAYRSIRHVIETAVEHRPEKVYLICGDLEVTYAELNRQINRAANGLLKLGVRKGDRVALLLPNRPEFLYAWLGLNKIGASMVPINTAFKSREAQYVIDHSESRFLLADVRYLAVLEPILREFPRLEGTIVLDEAALPRSAGVLARPRAAGAGEDAHAPSRFLSYAELVADASDE